MKTRSPRHPIAIIGAGIAGLSAAATLQEMGIPTTVLERFPQVGGRFASRAGDGWIADHGARYVHLKDETLMALMRLRGMERHRVFIQGPIYSLLPNRRIVVPEHGGVDSQRLCLDTGFSRFCRDIADSLPDVRYGTPVGAIRWDNSQKVFWWQEGSCFWFEDDRGEPIRDPMTRDVVKASGVILATTATVASRIAMKSASLERLVPVLSSVQYTSTFVGIYKVPRQKTPWFALQGTEDSSISWLSFEERKAPERIDEDCSLMVVHAGSAWSESLMGMQETDALKVLYAEARSIVPELPESPLTQTYKRWQVSSVRSLPVGFPTNQWATRPTDVPFSLAGDYLLGSRAEDAARSGALAAEMVAAQLPVRRSVLGLEIPV